MKKTLQSENFGPNDVHRGKNLLVCANPAVDVVLYSENAIKNVFSQGGKIRVNGKAGGGTRRADKQMLEIRGMDTSVCATLDDVNLPFVERINYTGYFSLNNGPGANVVTGENEIELVMSNATLTATYGSGLNGQPLGATATQDLGHHSAFGGDTDDADHVKLPKKRDIFYNGPGAYFAPDEVYSCIRDKDEHNGNALQNIFGGGSTSTSSAGTPAAGTNGDSDGVHTEPATRLVLSLKMIENLDLDVGLYSQNLKDLNRIGISGATTFKQGSEVDGVSAHAVAVRYTHQLGMGKVSGAARLINTTVESNTGGDLEDRQQAYSLGFAAGMGLELNVNQGKGYEKNILGQKCTQTNGSIVYRGLDSFHFGLMYSELDVDASGKLTTTTICATYKHSEHIDLIASHGMGDNTISKDGDKQTEIEGEHTSLVAKMTF